MTWKYKPSNGTEGMMFQSEWCEKCWKDRHAEDDPTKGCQILLRTMMYDSRHPHYPGEWRRDPETDEPICTAFLSYEEHENRCKKRGIQRYKQREAKGQQRLFA